jgi:fermentation-respiration switch protein FrsA (DUF1100 family)
MRRRRSPLDRGHGRAHLRRVFARLQRSLLYPRGFARPHEELLTNVPDLERWSLPIDDGAIEAVLLRAGGGEPRPAVVYAHGNAELIEYWVGPLSRYRDQHGIHLLLVEYRGYGRSGGKPSEPGITADFRAAYDRLAARPDVDAARIVGHGRSLGGGAIGTLAAGRPLAGLVFESTFTSVPEVVPWAPARLMPDRYDTRRVLRAFEGPVTLMHGSRDNTIPYPHAERLAEAARDAELLRFVAGHNDIPQDGRYWGAIDRLLKRAGVI